MDRRWIIVVLVLGLGAMVFFLTRDKVKSDIDEKAEQKRFFDPTLTDEEAKAKAAEEAAAAALLVAQQAEVQARVEEQATLIKQIEASLATTQASAILYPTTVNVQEAQALEKQASAERTELKRRWTDALTSAETSMLKAKVAAEVATDAYLSTMAKVIIVANDITALKKKYGEQLAAQEAKEGNMWERLAWISDYPRKLKVLEAKLEQAKNLAGRVRIEGVATISHTNDCVERVLTIIADIRLLGILLALCSRVDSIAKATREKMKELEKKLGG